MINNKRSNLSLLFAIVVLSIVVFFGNLGVDGFILKKLFPTFTGYRGDLYHHLFLPCVFLVGTFSVIGLFLGMMTLKNKPQSKTKVKATISTVICCLTLLDVIIPILWLLLGMVITIGIASSINHNPILKWDIETILFFISPISFILSPIIAVCINRLIVKKN